MLLNNVATEDAATVAIWTTVLPQGKVLMMLMLLLPSGAVAAKW